MKSKLEYTGEKKDTIETTTLCYLHDTLWAPTQKLGQSKFSKRLKTLADVKQVQKEGKKCMCLIGYKLADD